MLLKAETDPQSLGVLLERCIRTNRTKFRVVVVKPLPAPGLLEMTLPHQQRGARQRYRTTRTGMELLKNRNKEMTSDVTLAIYDFHERRSTRRKTRRSSGENKGLCIFISLERARKAEFRFPHRKISSTIPPLEMRGFSKGSR